MTIEEELYACLLPYCIKLGWIKFDETTENNRKINANSEILDWKVFNYGQESAFEYLRKCYPEVDESIIRKTITNNLKYEI